MTCYVALIHKEVLSDYGVEFPDLPGCVTSGTDFEDARRMASGVLALHIQGLVEDGSEVPIPSTLKAVLQGRKTKSAVAVLVEAPLRSPSAIRIEITLPKDLVEAIDRVGSNRSRFIADAVRAALRARRSDDTP